MNASTGTVETRSGTIDPKEAAHFGRLAAEWWDPRGESAMLHKLNPVRLTYIRAAIDRHWPEAGAARKPLAGRSAIDVGCGAGLLAEPLARLGARVTGLDAAAENVAAAGAHAQAMGLAIDYRNVDVETLAGETFDLVTSMEVIEHVTDPAAFVAALERALAPGGLMLLSTPNRTPISRLMLVEAAERLGQVPRGTHDWHKFLTPDELTNLLNDAGLTVIDTRGIAWDPLKGLHLSDTLALNYLMTVVRG
ncbi:bifunctional 2-polyprenyl-6-hydroxyphenol methylase/3-demethylubiquinol 3-O-methyltransferase UbiG [Blastomonas sp. UPD001]|jgi:2-polyprenyl-6-hydroxyphenyl methylase / 3-demethylubiquinone-9 3-methyltransferase|uniref:bifunctional 2-polyprenyl-6-hydroxyphenol methylase/3-demethylubiquinol 3-O-methyltransferase UbiG n=1 Tax=Blastomonas sp. UPD001 TaxID=2217673 RepID=UPI000E356EA3|nr:bifunctional 2-polyprenyl-6-hydroxyphenol methylase/3-demethylubiquinol 3-O-methyltransferase UbiG [Blastomonas sp. UPD001]MBL0966303.1 bifunctional 2-polyprenyl-6-hydroxyphenol methylase/3-demethylubiquinol 3-O-methyltransferase UbiG [Blastomonas sp.]